MVTRIFVLVSWTFGIAKFLWYTL